MENITEDEGNAISKFDLNNGFDIRKVYNLHAVQGGFKEKLYDTRKTTGGPEFEIADPKNPHLF